MIPDDQRRLLVVQTLNCIYAGSGIAPEKLTQALVLLEQYTSGALGVNAGDPNTGNKKPDLTVVP